MAIAFLYIAGYFYDDVTCNGSIGVSLSELHIDCDNGPCAWNNGFYLCIYMSVLFTPH